MAEFPKIVRDGLAARQGSATSHPDADLLTAFSEGSVTDAEHATVLEHAAICPECREVLVLTAEVEEPVEVGAVAPLAAKAEPQRARRWTWARLTSAAGVFAVLVVGATLLVRQSQRNTAMQAMKSTVASSERVGPPGANAEAAPAPERSNTPPSRETVPQQQMRRAPVQRDERQDLAQAATPQVGNEALKKAGTKPKDSENAFAIGGLRGSKIARNVTPAAPGTADGAYAYSSKTGERGQSKTLPLAGAAAAAQAAPSPASTADTVAAAKPSGAVTDRRAAASETVEVTAAAPAINTMTAQTSGKLAATQARGSQSNVAQNQAVQRAKIPVAWRISNQGQLEQTFDRKGWSQSTLPLSPVLAIATVGPHVWAGGTGGALFHSVDQGQSWSRVTIGSPDDITHIAFDNINSGKLTTSSGATWKTSDGGQTWEPEAR